MQLKDLANRLMPGIGKGPATAGSKSYRTIFDIAGVPAFRQFYDVGIYVWKDLYKGYYRPWHLVNAPTIKNANNTRDLYRLNTPKAVCAEIGSLVWGDACEVNITIDGVEPAEDEVNDDPLNLYVQEVLRKNAFQEKMQEFVEQVCALGGGALKTWCESRHDDEGNEIPDSREVRIGYTMADQFIPLAWDNARVTEGIFISRIAKNGWYYTRLEWHRWNGQTYVVTNELYRAGMGKTVSGESQDILGIRVPLAEVYPYMMDETQIQTEESLFAYFRTPIANNIDDNSPLGISVYGNALETLHALDICYDSFVREFRLGKKRIIVPARALRTVVDPESGVMRRYFDAMDEAYQALATDNPEDFKIQDNTVEIRVEEHVAALNAFLAVLCLQLGFSANTFSFDPAQGLKTATEVVSENSKTYKTVKTIQNQIAPAIEHMIHNIIDIAALYDLEYQGQKISALAQRGYHVNIVFDDGITQDRQTNLNEGIMLVGAGLLSKFTFLTDPKYGQGLTPEQAEAELKRIQEENAQVTMLDVNRTFGSDEG